MKKIKKFLLKKDNQWDLPNWVILSVLLIQLSGAIYALGGFVFIVRSLA